MDKTGVIVKALEMLREEIRMTADFDCHNDINRALTWIHDHIFSPHCTIKKMREACRFTNNNISSRFKNCVGCTPSLYIRQHRLHAAEVLRKLEGLKLTEAEIGFYVGYDSPSAFSKAKKTLLQ